MSYLVLARKWRPRRFAELVGQEHVVRALSNALDTGRVHHAFLFTGTRGVGKTTIARIFAKSLNCESGVSAEPCGECAICQAVDAGRFVDLLEIDAASNTGVDDVREVIENAQYAPTRGRYKVYLVDEVHMLSKSAFNALLKTLEEPPEHVKFLLATTDPQKLPVTVLSRCLQFNLKRLDEGQIRGQMEKILAAEGLPSEPGALALLAKGADGSLRDGLSLLDQAIAYTGATLDEAGVRAMLGTVDHARVDALLAALAAGDGAGLMREIETLATYSPDFGSVLEEVAAALHRVQLAQLVPGAAGEADPALASAVSPETVQLWYQMAVNGRRDLPYAPSPRAGFEMALLRMLAFRPLGEGEAQAPGPARAAAPQGAPARSAAPVAAPVSAPPASVAPDRIAEPAPPAPSPRPAPSPQPAAARGCASNDDWLDILERAELRGPAKVLASHTRFLSLEGRALTLALPEADELLLSDRLVAQLADAVASAFGGTPQIRFEITRDAEPQGETMHLRAERRASERQQQAEQAFLDEPAVQHFVQQYGATVVPGSIAPVAPSNQNENRS
ncbi:DNA polymerase III subunit gamma/tau [Coralloluteibacterium thermophilus]|uniref:DNA polymerase III subunit gamma/tau n=1 Tax=Coralloluteibacterium thermophilum TaxID=2707049 RepID=A0ABV9NGK0_9GAMM